MPISQNATSGVLSDWTEQELRCFLGFDDLETYGLFGLITGTRNLYQLIMSGNQGAPTPAAPKDAIPGCTRE